MLGAKLELEACFEEESCGIVGIERPSLWYWEGYRTSLQKLFGSNRCMRGSWDGYWQG